MTTHSRLMTAPPTLPRLRRLGVRRLTRAHLALQRHALGGTQGETLLQAVAAALSEQLGAQVEARARLTDAVLPEAGMPSPSAFALFELAAVGQAAVVEVELPFLVALLERVAGGPGRWVPATQLTRIEEATFGYLLLVTLAALRQEEGLAARLGPRLVGVTLERAHALHPLPADTPCVGVEVELRVNPLLGTVRLLLPSPALLALLEPTAGTAAGEIAPEVLRASLPARCLVGRSPVSLVELMRVDPGDVVTLEGTRRSGTGLIGPGRLLASGFELRGAFTADGFTLTGAHPRVTTLEPPMSQAVSPGPELTELSPALPVEVEVELARVCLPLAELSCIRPGSVLPLRVHASEPVLLRVGDRAVARAELVDIEGEVGARILTLLS